MSRKHRDVLVSQFFSHDIYRYTYVQYSTSTKSASRQNLSLQTAG